jgi:hypothetical protein
MSKLVRALVVGAVLAAMNLAGMTVVAHANDEPASTHDARRPPTERQVGESYRHAQIAADQPTIVGDARRPPSERQVASPGATRPAPRCGLPNPAASPAGSSLRWECWPRPWRWPAGWRCRPPSGQAAGFGSGRRPDHSHGHTARWGCRATRQPHRPFNRRSLRLPSHRQFVLGERPGGSCSTLHGMASV